MRRRTGLVTRLLLAPVLAGMSPLGAMGLCVGDDGHGKIERAGRRMLPAAAGGARRSRRPLLARLPGHADRLERHLLPLLVFPLHGTEIERPLAVVMVGGLVTSTVFTLLALPTFYALVVDLRAHASGRTQRARGTGRNPSRA